MKMAFDRGGYYVSFALTIPLLISGCRATQKPGSAEIPPLPPLNPEIYSDVNPRFSPDGKRIAFLRETPDRRLQLHLIDSELERPQAVLESERLGLDRPYCPTSARYCSPDSLVWSPNNRLVAFERSEWFDFDDGERLPGTGLWAYDTRTGRVTPLALHPKRYFDQLYYYHSPSWSPNGKYFSFIAEGINGQRRVGIKSVSQPPKDVEPLFDDSENSDWATWKPSFGLNAAKESALIYRQTIRKNASLPVTETLRAVHPGNPDGQNSGEIWRISQSELVKSEIGLKKEGFSVIPRIGHLCWSPTGKMIAFTLTPDANDFNLYQVWVWSSVTKQAKRVSPSDGRGFLAPIWIDERRIGAISPKNDKYEVVGMNVEKQISRTLGVIESADFDWSPDKSKIVYAVPKQDSPVNPDFPTTLKLFETNLRTTAPWKSELSEAPPKERKL